MAGFGTVPFGTGPFGGGTPDQWVEATTLIPADLLAPYGNEIRLWRGALTPAGPELIPVGTFGIRSVEFDSGGADFTGITVTGIDRGKGISETRFPFPRNSTPGMTALDTIRALVREVYPWADVLIDPATSDVVMPLVTWPQQRDQPIIDMLASVGAEMFCDPYGSFIIQPIPSPLDPPAYTVTAGPGGVLVKAQHSLTRDGVVNGVVARGQSTATTDPPPTSQLVVDTDPTSPTHWGGPFGKVVGFYDSNLLLTGDQCDNAAQALLLNNIGAARSLNYTTAVLPFLEPGDVIAVVDPDTGVTEQHLQDQLTIPLDAAGVMTAQSRSTLALVWHPKKRVQHLYGGSLS